jgi:hypothetical protein
MPNYKEINWDTIRADYVMNPAYPSYDDICKKHDISKPILIAKANDRDDGLNRGLTWTEQRERYVKKKQSVQEDVAVSEAKKAIATYIKVLNNIGLKAFKLIDKELDYLSKEQDNAIEDKKHYPIGKHVKISDLTKIADVLYKMSNKGRAREILVKLELAEKKAKEKGVTNLSDLTDAEFEVIEQQVKSGGALALEDSSE